MRIYLNPKHPWNSYSKLSTGKYFVDKSYILSEIAPLINTNDHFLCVTRPRRFGKSNNAIMLASFFGRAYPQRDLFSGLAVGSDPAAMAHCGKYEIIYIQAHKVAMKTASGDAYLANLKNRLFQDLQSAYQDLSIDEEYGLGVALDYISEEKDVEFVVVIDEWDYLFHQKWATEEDRRAYITFLGEMCKDVSAVALAYLTGILPMTIFSSVSDTNMFAEYPTPDDTFLSKGFGFTEAEVDTLFQRFRASTANPRITRDDLREWYDGYICFDGTRLYNPQSVCFALIGNKIGDYWTRSGAANEIYTAVSRNVDAVRDDVARLVSGLSIPLNLNLTAGQSESGKDPGEGKGNTFANRKAILNRMVLLGFLSYGKGYVRIPNNELMSQFDDMLQTEPSLDYVYRLALKSQQVLEATLKMDTKTVEEVLAYAHNTESPLLQYNQESDLTVVVTLCYLAARSVYHMKREDKGGTGYVDFIFYPKTDPTMDGIILELKVDATPDEALQQIKDNQYVLAFGPKIGEKPHYTGRILGVGIAYDKKTKEHHCKIEVLREAVNT